MTILQQILMNKRGLLTRKWKFVFTNLPHRIHPWQSQTTNVLIFWKPWQINCEASVIVPFHEQMQRKVKENKEGVVFEKQMYHSYENWKDDRGTRQKGGEALSGAHPPFCVQLFFFKKKIQRPSSSKKMLLIAKKMLRTKRGKTRHSWVEIYRLCPGLLCHGQHSTLAKRICNFLRSINIFLFGRWRVQSPKLKSES